MWQILSQFNDFQVKKNAEKTSTIFKKVVKSHDQKKTLKLMNIWNCFALELTLKNEVIINLATD